MVPAAGTACSTSNPGSGTPALDRMGGWFPQKRASDGRPVGGRSVRFSPPVPGAPRSRQLPRRGSRFVGRSDFLKCAQARLDPGNRRDGRKALACGGGVTVALYVETHEEAPRFGLIHPALPLFELAAECYPDEHRN